MCLCAHHPAASITLPSIAFNARPHHTVETCHEREISHPLPGCWHNEIDKSLVCKRCLLDRDAWEEVVADKAPEEWQDLDSQPITTGPLTGGHHEIHTPNWSIVALDAGGYKVLIEGTKYVKKFKFEAGDTFVYNEENWAVVFNEIGRLEEERDELKTKLAAIESRREEDVKAYAVIQEERDELLEAQVALMKERNEWKAATHGCVETNVKIKAERDELKSKGERLCQELGNLMQVTRNHTLKNLEQIMKAAPAAEDLEGYEFELKVPINGEWWCHNRESWYTAEGCLFPHFVRIPIVEYIEGDEITDELPDNHGRIPCEFSDDGIKWYGPQLLIEVIDTHFRIHQRGLFSHCRIKKSDLEESAK